MLGIVGGVVGAMLKIPMSAFGTAFIGNIWALSMLGIGFLLRAYAQPVAGIDINALYIPHGVMVGAGLTLREAMPLANRAGGVVVGKFGTATVSYEELFA